ncbi:hypothetical protein GWK47_019419 [Chionoecetes opilio]|uniref:Uncharacterized protein n=1 Tax=Chionoecetes opilio TaxID=41210 RepID=A0A8J4XQT4_CHIOP|nr:hypothetical protein GWK47_019419 [Chionoecetes opilio]
MVWLDLHHRGTGRRDGEVLHSPPWMVFLPHQSPPSGKGQCVVLQLAGSVIGGEELYGGFLRFSTVSLCEESTKDHRSRSRLKDSNVRTRGRAEAGFEDILGDHLVEHDGGRPTKASLSRVVAQSECKPLAPMPVFEAVVSKQKAMILFPTPASSTSFKTTAATFRQSNRACRETPRKGTRRHLPCEEDGDASLRIAREDGRVFPSQCRTNLSGISWFRSSTIFSAACSLPAIRARWTVLF